MSEGAGKEREASGIELKITAQRQILVRGKGQSPCDKRVHRPYPVKEHSDSVAGGREGRSVCRFGGGKAEEASLSGLKRFFC